LQWNCTFSLFRLNEIALFPFFAHTKSHFFPFLLIRNCIFSFCRSYEIAIFPFFAHTKSHISIFRSNEIALFPFVAQTKLHFCPFLRTVSRIRDVHPRFWYFIYSGPQISNPGFGSATLFAHNLNLEISVFSRKTVASSARYV
jgi:hypothetical protein